MSTLEKVVAKNPGPDIPWWTQLKMIRQDFLGFLEETSTKYGELFLIRPSPFTRIWVVNSAELVHDILVTKASLFGKSQQTKMMVGKFLGNGLVTSEGDDHQRQKRDLLPHFALRNKAALAELVQSHMNRFAEEALNKKEIDLEQAMSQVSLNVITDFLIGHRESAQAEIASQTFRLLAQAISRRFQSIPWPSWIPSAANRLDAQALRQADHLVDQLLDLADIQDSSENVLKLLAKQERSGQISKTQVRDSLITLLFAGHETVAKVLVWTLSALAIKPDLQKQLRQEITSQLSSNNIQPLDFLKLKHLGSTIKESLRLMPPVWVFDRSPIQKMRLQNQDIYPKDILYLSPFILQRQPRYFSNSLDFDSERFMSDKDIHLPEGAYFPFGLGPRACIGQAFASIESAVAIGLILKKFDLRLSRPALPKFQASATLGPAEAINMQFTLA